VGDFTAADVIMSFPIEVTEQRMGSLDGFPHLAKYLEQIHERPAYKRALEKGGKFELVG
jgi:glutathione S-transferase